jgi:hypothetical protein
MNSCKIMGIRRIALLAALLVMLSGVFALVPPVEALPCGVITTYYTDAGKTTAVGQRGTDCDCNDISWGVTTPYYRLQAVCS